jgi:hypothetical protein
MGEYYLSHQPRIIVAEVPTDETPGVLKEPLAAEEWMTGWLITAPADPRRCREIMAGIADLLPSLPGGTLLLYPCDPASLADVMENWLEGLETDINMPFFLEEEVEDNVEGFRNLVLGEVTLWEAFREILEPLPSAKACMATVEDYEAVLEGALEDYRKAAGRLPKALSVKTVHEFSQRAKQLLVKEKRAAILQVMEDLAAP